MYNSHLQFALISIRARQSNTSPWSINLCRRLLCFVGATLRLRLRSWLWCFCCCQVFTEDWYCALWADSLSWLGISYQLSRSVWTKTPATWSEHLCAQGGADGPECQLWRQRRLLELELGCCVKVVWPGCCCLCPLAATALLYCTVTLHRDISLPLAICNLVNNCLRLCYLLFWWVNSLLPFFVVLVSKYLLDFSSYFIGPYLCTVQRLYSYCTQVHRQLWPSLPIN